MSVHSIPRIRFYKNLWGTVMGNQLHLVMASTKLISLWEELSPEIGRLIRHRIGNLVCQLENHFIIYRATVSHPYNSYTQIINVLNVGKLLLRGRTLFNSFLCKCPFKNNYYYNYMVD